MKRFWGILFVAVSLQATYENNTLDFIGDDSGPYLIRWAMQKKADYVYDKITNKWMWPTTEEGVSFKPSLVGPGDLVFMRNAPKFFKKVHPKIKHPYIVVTMGEWRESVQDEWLDYLDDDKIIAWFSIHGCERTHPKFHLLPIGLFQRRDIYTNRRKLNEYFKELRAKPKTKLLYSNHGDLFSKKPERKELDDYMADKPWCTRSEHVQALEFVDYMKEMSDFKFTLSPRGYGIDCYRTWEAIMAGSIPIVRHSQLDPLYEGLPILVIDNWEDLTEEFLHKKYKEMASKKYDISPLYLSYWLNKIDKIRTEYFKKR